MKQAQKSLADIRKEKRLTQFDMAEKLGVTNTYYSTIENGHRSPSVKLAKAIADILGIHYSKVIDNAK